MNGHYHPNALEQLKKNALWYMALGVGLVIFGAACIVYAFSATMFSVVYFGILLIIAGLFEGVKAFKINKWDSFFLHIFLCILYIAVGILIIKNPIENAITLTLLLALFFVISGLAKIAFSLLYNVPHKWLILLNGVITVILGILIWQQWPASGLWVIGMFLGIDLIFTGISWISLALFSQQLPSNVIQQQKHPYT